MPKKIFDRGVLVQWPKSKFYANPDIEHIWDFLKVYKMKSQNSFLPPFIPSATQVFSNQEFGQNIRFLECSDAIHRSIHILIVILKKL